MSGLMLVGVLVNDHSTYNKVPMTGTYGLTKEDLIVDVFVVM